MITCFALASFVVNAQDSKQETYPYWTISKGVQQLQFKNATYVPSIAVSGENSIVVSKGVHTAGRSQSKVNGTVRKTGPPSWVISKDVARMRQEKE
jgi:hypothetical protein